MGGLMGLDYMALLSVASILGIVLTPDLICRIKVIETEILTRSMTNNICSEKDRALCEAQFGEFLDGACKQCPKSKEVHNARSGN